MKKSIEVGSVCTGALCIIVHCWYTVYYEKGGQHTGG